MGNIAEKFKKQTDEIFRQQNLNGSGGITISGISTGTGAPPPTIVNPSGDLLKHKMSGDHDGRYYTKAEIDALIAEASARYEPLTDGNSNLIFYAGDVVMGRLK